MYPPDSAMALLLSIRNELAKGVVCMNTARFLIAKFVPDLSRMEPRNFGLLLWTEHGTACRFLGEQKDEKVRAPRFVHPSDRDAYRQWVDYCKTILRKRSLQSNTGESVTRSSPRFFDVVRTKAKPQFMLVDGGKMLDAVAGSEVPFITDNLFETVVKYKH